MVSRNLDRSPSPSLFGFSLGRRGLIKGAAGAAVLGATGIVLPSGQASAQPSTPTATGDLSVGSNYSDAVPKSGLEAAIATFPNKNITITVNTTDHNTFQENITTYLQNPDDVIPWFAGYRLRYFAAQDLLGPIDDVWAAGLDTSLAEGLKVASTGDDGKLYFVPWNYYCWGIHYRPSLFAENSWTPPTNLDELMSLASNMQDKGITPFAFANDGRWPAMGTFDQLNFRLNGYQFHVDLMAGKEKWTDERVKNVFTTWESLLQFHEDNPNGRTWQEAAASVVDKKAGMMTIGNFIGQQFPNGDTSDLDFFPFPELNAEWGTGTVEAPIDGWMMAKNPKNAEAAKELLYHFGTSAAQAAYLSKDPSAVAAAPDIDRAVYNSLQLKALDTVAAAPNVTQFLDRDTSPEFASNVAGPAPCRFPGRPLEDRLHP